MRKISKVLACMMLSLLFVFGIVACGESEKPETTVVPTGITLSETSKTLDVGETFTLTVTITPENAADKTVTFTSSAESVASVTEKGGVVTAVAEGTAKITATTANGKTAECTVTVNAKAPEEIAAESVQLNETAKTLEIGGTFTLTATVLPDNATNKTVTFASDKTDVATVTEAGVVTAVAAGTAKITATTANGKTAECTVTVNAPVVLSSVSVKTAPTKVLYKVGEQLDLTGGVLELVYSDDSKQTVDMTAEGVTVAGFDSSKVAADQAVTVTYQEKTCEFKVSFWNIEFTKPNKLVYFAGVTEPDLTGAKVVLYNPDGSKEESGDLSDSFDIEVIEFNAEVAGETVCKLRYLEKYEFSFDVTIKESKVSQNSFKDADWVKDSVIMTDNGASYTVGEQGMTIQVAEGVGHWGKVKMNINPQIGAYAVVIKISGQAQTTFDIRFENGLDPINKGCAYMSVYQLKDAALHPTVRGDGKTAVAGTYYGLIPFVPYGQDPNVNYNGPFGWKENVQPVINKLAAGQMLEVTFSVSTFGDDPAVLEEFYFVTQEEFEQLYAAESKIKLQAPTRTEYAVGDTIDLEGGSVSVLNQYGELLKTLALTDEAVTIENADFATAGQKTITVKYASFSAEFTVTVAEAKPEIVLTNPTKTEYYLGAKNVNLDGGYFTVTEKGGEPKQVALNDPAVTVQTFDCSKAGASKVVLKYMGEEFTYDITVVQAFFNTELMKNQEYLTDCGIRAAIGSVGSWRIDENGNLAVTNNGSNNDAWGGVDLDVYIPANAEGMSVKAYGPANTDYF